MPSAAAGRIRFRAYPTPIATGISQTKTKLATPAVMLSSPIRRPSTAPAAASRPTTITARARPLRIPVSAGTNASVTR